jgi:K+-sensing histidine kinase KdpD
MAGILRLMPDVLRPGDAKAGAPTEAGARPLHQDDTVLIPYTTAFYQTAGGLGLGLAVVKSLVDAHGGEIHAENMAPHGTRMTLIIPAVP